MFFLDLHVFAAAMNDMIKLICPVMLGSTCWILMKDVTCVSVMSCLHRQTTLAVYVMSLVGLVLYAFTLDLGHLWVVFITAGALGYLKISNRNIFCFVISELQ